MVGKTAKQTSPRLVGGYELVERLATTDMGAVFKGRNPVTEEVVAIKMAGAAVTRTPILLTRFSQEFTVTRGLDHPHLVRALRFGYEEETPYMVLEYVDGASLGDRIEKEGRLAEAEALRIITQIGKALHYAHQHRVIHRDVKPDNILLRSDGQAKLADLGLAKDYDADCDLTRPSTGLGTPNFMAPEQFSDAKNADSRCDIYSLAATLYMALTGELPFRGRSHAVVLKKKLANDLTPPRKLVPELSPGVEAAILRAVDVNPRARPSTCLEFIKELNDQSYAQAARAGESATAQATRTKTGKGAERRATVRYPSSRDSSCQPLRGANGVRWSGKVQDISADGVALILGRRFEPRTVLNIELAPTDQEPGRRMLVRVVRVRSLSSRRWLLGCVFPKRLNDDEVRNML